MGERGWGEDRVRLLIFCVRVGNYCYLHTLCAQFEDGAHEAADELTQPRPEGEEHVEDIQVLLKSDANPIQIRDLRVCYNNIII